MWKILQQINKGLALSEGIDIGLIIANYTANASFKLCKTQNLLTWTEIEFVCKW